MRGAARMPVTRAVWQAVMSAALAAVAGCDEPPDSPRGRVQGFITVIGVGEDDSAWQSLRQAAESRADHYPPLSVRTVAPPARSTEAQIRLVRAAQRGGARGICVQVDQPAVLLRELELVRAAGIAVVTLVSPVPSKLPFLHSGFDAAAQGAALADLTAEAAGRRGLIAFVQASGPNPIDVQTREAFARRMTSHPSIQVLPGMDHDGNLRDTQARVDACAERFPRLSAWAFLDRRLLDGAADAVLRVPPTESSARFVSAGLSPLVRQRLDDGACFAAVEPDYEHIMRHGLDLCATMAQGLLVTTKVYDAPLIVTRGPR